MKIEDLGLSVRPYNVLKRAGIDTVEKLQQLSDDDLMRFRNMGRHSLAENREKVAYVKTMTNADRIRVMSDKELGRFLAEVESRRSPAGSGAIWNGAAHAIHWLRQPAEEDTK